MGTKATWALVVAASALTGTGAGRAQDAEQPTTTRGSIVLPVGDKVHGCLRGGETHALQVHLAKGDVYSFDVNSNKRGDPLLMHLELIDPTGREVTGDARVAYRAGGKRVTMGPYVAPVSGTYVIELSAQSWFSGDYWGTSKVRGARRSVVPLPAGGATVEVNVAAGSTLRLRSGKLSSFVMATPNGQPNSFAGGDPLVKSLRAKGLSSGETGVYQFAAPGGRAATIEITKPRWKSTLVDVPTLPDDPMRLAQFEWIDEWKQLTPTAVDPTLTTEQSIPSPRTIADGPPVAVAPSAPGATSSLFLGAGMNAMAAISEFLTPKPAAGSVPAAPSPPEDPDTLPPATSDLPTTPAGTPLGSDARPVLPSLSGARLIGAWEFVLSPGWRDVPWTQFLDRYPAATAAGVFPPVSGLGDTERGRVEAALAWTATYRVDGHEVDALLATGGETTIDWNYAGTLEVDGRPWTIDGSWTMRTRLPVSDRRAIAMTFSRTSRQYSLSGAEHLQRGAVTESIVVSDLTLNPRPIGSDARWWMGLATNAPACDPTGAIKNVLSDTRSGLSQVVVHEFLPTVWGVDPSNLPVPTDKALYVRTTTVDSSTVQEGVESSTSADETFRSFWYGFHE